MKKFLFFTGEWRAFKISAKKNFKKKIFLINTVEGRRKNRKNDVSSEMMM